MKPLIITLLLQLTMFANAGDVERIYSITGQTNDSKPGTFFFKDRMFVFADDGIHGYQLFECDSANTLHAIAVVKEAVGIPMQLNDKLFFFSGSPQNRYALWEFNGIDPPVKMYTLGNYLNNTLIYQVFSNKIYTYIFGDGLQVFDGINPPKKIANSANFFHTGYPPALTVYKNKLYFISTDNINGNELWSIDSTGTISMLADINPAGNSNPSTPQVHKGRLYFWADDGTHGKELWEYDGTNAPRMIGDINSGTSSSGYYNEQNLIEYKDKLFFTAFDGIHEGSLWEYDGYNSPRLVPGTEDSYASDKFIFGDKLYYYDPSFLCEYDGINNAKQLLYSYDWDKPAIFEDNLYIWGSSGDNREDLYRYDGINPPENLTASIITGMNGIDPDFIIVNNRLCFQHSSRLYTLSGDSIRLIDQNFPQSFTRLGFFNHRFYYSFQDPFYGTELWSMDGIHAPVMMADLNNTLIVPGSLSLRESDNKLYFTFEDSIRKYVEFDSMRFTAFSPDFDSRKVYNLLSFKDKYYYNRETGRISTGLFENNGIQEHQISSGSSGAGLIIYKNAIYYYSEGFLRYDGENPPEKIADLDNEPTLYQTVFNDKLLLFTGRDSMTFWEYDNINPPQKLGRCLAYDAYYQGGFHFAEMNHKFYFTGFETEHGKEPWVYDGSNPPAMFADIAEGAPGSSPLYFTAFRNKLFFSAVDEIHGREIWVYDGINPPEILSDIEKGPGSSSPEQLTVTNNKLFFKAYTKKSGTELWQYDGTHEPSIVSDLNRGTQGSDPNDLVVYKDQLYLSAVTGENGRQLYRLSESCSNPVISACGSFDFNGTSLYSSGRYYDTIPGYMGQDSIIRLDLTILASTTTEIDTTVCGHYVFSGLTLTESGVYYDTLQNTAGCDSITILHLTINHLNTAVNYTASGLESVYSGGGYQWISCDGNYLPVPGAVDQSYTPTTPGNYAVILNDQGCIDTSDCYLILPTDLEEYGSKQVMTIFPNPSSGALTIDLGKLYSEAWITITRYDGEVIRNKRVINSRSVDLNLDEPPGIYTVNVFTETQKVNLKLILK